MLRWQIGLLAGLGLLCGACGNGIGGGCFGFGLTIRPAADTVAVGDTAHFTVTPSCGGDLGPIRWQSSDTTVAPLVSTSSTLAVVAGRAAGAATITASPVGDPVLRAQGTVVVEPRVGTAAASR